MKQFKDPDWTPADHFTIPAQQVNVAADNLRKWFGAMLNHAEKQNQTSNAVGSVPSQAQVPGQETSMPPLNASNLMQLEQQEAARQRAKRAQTQGSTAPPAPTTSQPPFPLGATSPQGVPHIYANQPSVTQENLHIPPQKKQKRNATAQKDAGKQTAQTQPSPAPPAQKQQVQKKTPKPTDKDKKAFKCEVPECQYHVASFASQAELDKHTEEHHTKEEPITNPLEYAIEGFTIGLGLDKKKTAGAEPGDQKQKKQAESSEGAAQGVKTAKSSASQAAGTKAKSPGPNQGKTPGGNNTLMPPPSSSRVNPAVSKDGKEDAGKTSESPPDETKDPWADSLVSLEDIRETFGGFGDEALFNLGRDPLDELLASEAFTNIQTKDTPQSAETGANTTTPQDSDHSKDEDPAVRIGGDGRNSTPSDWVQLPAEIEESLLVNEPWEEIDWDSMLVDDWDDPSKATDGRDGKVLSI